MFIIRTLAKVSRTEQRATTSDRPEQRLNVHPSLRVKCTPVQCRIAERSPDLAETARHMGHGD